MKRSCKYHAILRYFYLRPKARRFFYRFYSMKTTLKILLSILLLPTLVFAQTAMPDGISQTISTNEAAQNELYSSFTGTIIPELASQVHTCTTVGPIFCSTVVPPANQAVNSCTKLHSLAKISCASQTYGPYIGLFLGQMGSAVASSGQDQYKQCKNAAIMQAALGAKVLIVFE